MPSVKSDKLSFSF